MRFEEAAVQRSGDEEDTQAGDRQAGWPASGRAAKDAWRIGVVSVVREPGDERVPSCEEPALAVRGDRCGDELIGDGHQQTECGYRQACEEGD